MIMMIKNLDSSLGPDCEPGGQTAAGNDRGEAPGPAADLDHAAGRPLSAGVSRKSGKRSGSFLELCYNPALAAEVTLQPLAAVRARCGDPVLGHPRHSRCAWARPCRFEDRGRPAARADHSGRAGEVEAGWGCSGTSPRSSRRSERVKAGAGAGQDADRLLRVALDRGDLHDRWPRLARPGGGAAVRAAAAGGVWRG